MNDPSQLLERIPELEPLAADKNIRRAIEGGDPFKGLSSAVLGQMAAPACRSSSRR
jgi:hypothetical protein